MPESNEHIVKSYDQELRRLQGLVVGMGGMVENQVALACEAILQRDEAAAARAIEADVAVDAREREIEEAVIRMLALRQPVAQDLRMAIGALKATGDLERIGDYAANVGKRIGVVGQFDGGCGTTGMKKMARLVQENLTRVIDAIGSNDVARAVEVWSSDEAIDAVYDALFRELITYMMEDPRNITPCTHLLFVAKNLERIGDHATNLAETVHYAVTGVALTQARPKRDGSSFAVVTPDGTAQ